MTVVFATYQDVEARWRDLDADEQARCTPHLGDAAAKILAEVDFREGDEEQARILKFVSCSMVIRSMVASSSDAFGVGELQATMGPFNQRVNFTNPYGDLYFTGQERRMLGIDGPFVGDMRAAIDGFYGTNAEVADG